MRKMKNLLLMLTVTMAILFVGSSIVSAQNDRMNDKDQTSKDKMSSDKMMMSETDTNFAQMAAMGGMAEVRWAELAMQKSTDKAVKKYASKMMKDHTKANKNLMKIAAKHNMTLPTTMSDEQMQITSQLQQASGADFDRMYIQMAGVDAHQKMEALFQGEVSGGTNADLKGFAAKTLPVVQMHLRMAQERANGGMTGDKMMKGDSMKKDSMNH